MKWLFIVLSFISTPVLALDNPAWEQKRQEALRNGDQQMLDKLYYISHAGRLRNMDGTEGPVSCCGAAEAYEADDIWTDEYGNSWAVLTCNDPTNCEEIPGKVVRKPGEKFIIPNDRHLANHTPVNHTGHGWIWISPNGTSYYGEINGNGFLKGPMIMQPTIICYTEPPGS